jgi:hypothetical protein
MDRLGIEIEAMPWEIGRTDSGQDLPGGGGAVTRVLLNGEDLLEVIRRCELPSASASGEAHLAGWYAPLWGYRFESELFFGEPLDPELRHRDGVILMGCNCGVIGCWPLVVRMRMTNDCVTWTSFEQPFRSRWDYSSLEPLAFERSAYESEVRRAGQRFAELVANSDEQRSYYEQRVRVLRAKYPDHEWPDWPMASGAGA